MMYSQRFSLTAVPFPKAASGKTFFDGADGFRRLQRGFQMLTEEPGLGVLTAEPGVGKTAAMRHLTGALPRPQYRVVYLCDTAIAPVDVYRSLALELGLKPAFRRSQLWRDLKDCLLHLVDERAELPILVIDEAHHLSDRFLADLSGFLNFAFDSRDLFTTWLVGMPPLRARLRMQVHAALHTRLVTAIHLEPFTSREDFTAFLDHGFAAVGAQGSLIADSARELLFRASAGLPREIGKIVRKALRLADERNLNFIDETIIEAVIGEGAIL